MLTKNIKDDITFFKMVDVPGETSQIVWDFELWRGFAYVQDKPWFHSFEMDGYMGGLNFADDVEGRRFYRNVICQVGQIGMPLLLEIRC